jgi:hypothetical protein
MALAELLPLLRAMPEENLLALLPTLPRAQLEKLWADYGIEDEDEAPRSHYLPWACLVRLGELLRPDLRRPAALSRVLLSTRMADVMNARRDAGEHLRHPQDWIQHEAPERIARIVHRARNGSPLPGRLQRIDASLPDEEPGFRDELLADLAARRAERGPS